MCSLHARPQAGLLDSSFGNSGIVLTDLGYPNQIGKALAIQSDGKIVVAGSLNNNGHIECTLLRYLNTGTPDSSFGSNGFVSYDMNPISTSSEVTGCIIQTDGKILVVGSTMQWNNLDYLWDVAVVRFNTDGSLDQSFGNNGKFATDIMDNGYQWGKAIALQPDGKILIAGGYSTNYDGGGRKVAVIRLNENGTYDYTFGLSGLALTEVGLTENSMATAIAVQPDNKILVTGQNSAGFIIRYLTDGTPDNTFGTNGIVTSSYGYGSAIAIQPDNKIVIGANFWDVDHSNCALIRYNSDGSLDSAFGNAGLVEFNSTDYAFCFSVLIQSDNKIILTGIKSIDSYRTELLLVRYESSGAPDSTFGTDGIILTELTYSIACTDAVLAADEKIILTGNYSSTQGANPDFTLVRYNNDINVGIPQNNSGNSFTSLLEQNFPNPFTSHTVITYHLPFSSKVSLSVFDQFGRKVAVLVDAFEFPGIRSVEFNISKPAFGIYFYSLQFGDHFETKKMIVVQ